MRTRDFVSIVARKTGVRRALVEKVLNCFGDTIVQVLKENDDEKIVFPHLGIFKLKSMNERTGVSKITGEKWTQPSHKKLYFMTSDFVKEWLK